MKRENSKVRNRRKDKRALDRAMLRVLHNAWLGGEPGKLEPIVIATLYGVERARRTQ